MNIIFSDNVYILYIYFSGIAIKKIIKKVIQKNNKKHDLIKFILSNIKVITTVLVIFLVINYFSELLVVWEFFLSRCHTNQLQVHSNINRRQF